MNSTSDSDEASVIANSTNSSDYSMLPFYSCLFLGVCGLTTHVLVIIFTFESSLGRNPISSLLVAISSCEAVLCIYWCWLSLSFGLQQQLYMEQAGFTGCVFFSATIGFDTVLSLNRFSAVCKPLQYKQQFSQTRTVIYIVAVLLLSCIASVPYSVPGCRVISDFRHYRGTWEATECGKIVSYAAEVFGCASHISLLLNLYVLGRMRRMRMLSRTLRCNEVKRKAHQEKRYFIQSCVSSTSISTIVLLTSFVALATQEKWGLFFITALLPTLLLVLNGIVVLIFNEAIYNALMKHFKRLEKSTTVELARPRKNVSNVNVVSVM